MSFQGPSSPSFAGGLITSSVFIHGDVAPGSERSEVGSLVSPKVEEFPNLWLWVMQMVFLVSLGRCETLLSSFMQKQETAA